MIDASRLRQIEFLVTDVHRAIEWYENVMGWIRVPAEIHQYIVLSVPEGSGFGIALVPGRKDAEDASAGPVLYWECEDPQAVAQRAVHHGGTKRFGPHRMPGYGEIWQITDPDGNRIGLFIPGPSGANRVDD